MSDQKTSIARLLESLKERAKELNCLYAIEELLSDPDAPLDLACEGIIHALPPGWQYPEVCQAAITLEGKTYQSPNFEETPWMQSANIVVQDKIVGSIRVYYTKIMPTADYGPFLKEEKKLIETIADRVGHFLFYQKMKGLFHDWQAAKKDLTDHRKADWQVVLGLLRQTDKDLYLRISNKMLNHMCWSGIREAEAFRQTMIPAGNGDGIGEVRDENRPDEKRPTRITPAIGERIFDLASDHLSEGEILTRLQRWIREDKLSALVQVLHRPQPLSVVTDALRRYHHQAPEGADPQDPAYRGVQVSLIRRILSDQLQYINVAKNFVDVDDLYRLIRRVIFSGESHGKLGGKSSGLFLADRILHKLKSRYEPLRDVRIPKTWYITSDMMFHFMHYNNFAEIVEQKYKEINRVRLEYPHIIQTFKNSHFPPEMVNGLSMALDEFKDAPLIVRSSSLLEDRTGAAFFGKYKSLFLANQGDKEERLDALMDAVAEVYSSLFGPDPIEYRADRGLLDFSEQMGIMIQEVVGTRMGPYYLPSYAGVALSRNEFRWSPRIKREDGIIRIVPGLGTRAVDRTSDDYPVLIAPGQPGLRVNASVEDTLRYAPKKIDVINLETNAFETVDIAAFLRSTGMHFRGIERIISLHRDGSLQSPMGLDIDFEDEDPVVTFEGLTSGSSFVGQVRTILRVLEKSLGTPVDIEFASDGKHFYLLQCRPQCYNGDAGPSPIPKDVPSERILFSANRYVSNGRVPNITHIVYIDPERYASLENRSQLQAVGKAVGRLNRYLPKGQFVLMGPGRWGSRGDIKLGVNVTYSDINNTAMLIEIARQRGGYVPDLSFGTHFFQDLVESGIRYLPLYPDEAGALFNEGFFRKARNMLPEIMPEFDSLSDTVKLIDVPKSAEGLVLQILMNGDLDEALGLLTERRAELGAPAQHPKVEERNGENYWRWRLAMAVHIAGQMDPDRYGVAGIYVFGSTKNATAGPGSDIDLLIHFRGSEQQRRELDLWLQGWSLCLDEMNYLQTGYRSGGLLDVHFITDQDIAERNSYAMKIGAVTDAARPLQMGQGPNNKK